MEFKFRNEKVEKYILEALYKYVCMDYFLLIGYIAKRIKKDNMFRIDTQLKYLRINEYIHMIKIDSKNCYVLNSDKLKEIEDMVFLDISNRNLLEKIKQEDIRKYYYLANFHLNATQRNLVDNSKSYFGYAKEDSLYPISFISGKKTISYYGNEGMVPYCIYAFTDSSEAEYLTNINQIMELLGKNKKFIGIALIVNICKNYEEVYRKVDLLSKQGKLLPVTYSLNINSSKRPLDNLFKCEFIQGNYVIKKIHI